MNNTALENTAIGYQAFQTTSNFLSHGNTAIGYKALRANSGLGRNTAVGSNAMLNNTTGEWCTAMGNGALYTNTTGTHNTAVGGVALVDNATGAGNAAFGYGALIHNISGHNNTSVGLHSMKENNTGSGNVALGYEAGWKCKGSGNIFIGYQAGYNELGSNKLYIANSSTATPLIYGDFGSENVGIGTNNPTFKLEVIADVSFNGVRVGRGNGNVVTNTAIGANTLNNNTSSDRNTAVGYLSLSSNSLGSRNTAIGAESMKNNTTGNWNTSIGDNALVLNTIGTHNSAFGALALNANISGGGNTAAGYGSLMTLTSGIHNSGFGMYSNKSLTTGNNNAALGYEAGYLNSTGSGNVFLGYQAGYNETGSNKLYIANSSTSTPLIYGDFSSSRIGLGTNNPQYNLDVTGDINFTGEIRKNGSPIVMDGSETKVNAGNNITVTGNGTTATPYTISAGKPKFYLGQDTLGGYVYYIYLDANGEQHGLIVSKTETTANWSSSSGLVGADRTYDGSYNMVLMFNSTARDWVSTNFTSEWFLPSIDQLILLFNARMHVNKALHWGGFTQLSFNNSYWSSFEYDSSAGMYLHFSNSETGAATKPTNMLVRAVRTF